MHWELFAAGTRVAELRWLDSGPVPVRVNPPFACFLDWWLERAGPTFPDPEDFTRQLRELEASGFRVRTPGGAGQASPVRGFPGPQG